MAQPVDLSTQGRYWVNARPVVIQSRNSDDSNYNFIAPITRKRRAKGQLLTRAQMLFGTTAAIFHVWNGDAHGTLLPRAPKVEDYLQEAPEDGNELWIIKEVATPHPFKFTCFCVLAQGQ